MKNLLLVLLLSGCSQESFPSVDSGEDLDAGLSDTGVDSFVPRDAQPALPPIPSYCELHPRECCGSCSPIRQCPPGEGCCFAWHGTSLFCAPDLITCANLGALLGCVPQDSPICEPHWEPPYRWELCE